MIPERGEDEIALHGPVERQIEPARTIQARLRASHAALIESDDVGELRDLEKERKDRAFRVQRPRSPRSAREPDDRRSRPGRRRPNPQEGELDRGSRRACVILGNGEPAELRGDARRAVARLDHVGSRSDASGFGGGGRRFLRGADGGGEPEAQKNGAAHLAPLEKEDAEARERFFPPDEGDAPRDEDPKRELDRSVKAS